MKGAINRQRPEGAPYAYPSGHTFSAFATAGVVYKHYGKTWGISAFVLALEYRNWHRKPKNDGFLYKNNYRILCVLLLDKNVTNDYFSYVNNRNR